VSVARLESAMAAVAAAVEGELSALLPPALGQQARLHEAMRYAVLGGGKRLRPFLVAATGALFDVPERAATRAGAAVELIHAYSLVHDDLPAMDDAALRRGRPSCHRAFDEATAILAGDALQALAFEVLARDGYGADAAQRCALLQGLARAAGPLGMCGGQMIDLLAERRTLSLAEVRELQALKTGAIIAFCCEAGAVLGRAAAEERAALAAYAADLGLAFQIRDDLLDLEGDSAVTGKDAGRDSEVGKATFVRLLGEDGARAKLAALRREALGQLDIFGDRATVLGQLFDFVIDRRS
jgi:farnesyl diphosphate synthase